MFKTVRERGYKLGWFYYNNNNYIKTHPYVLLKMLEMAIQ